MSAKAKQDLIITVVIYLGSGFLLALTGSMLPDAALFPRMILILVLFLNTLNAAITIKKDMGLRRKNTFEPSMLTFETAKFPLLVFLATVAYVVVFSFTNYFISTAIMLVAFMLVEKVKIKWIALITVVYLAFIYYLFVVQLSVQLIR
uniref:tripartite tricarboxylate transporter TctB family protein n=1 Tax=Ndongobacter massiliensis TaxID=1871025 RepID=UPI000930D7B8|nr:tripartite tricarboxylate transporter TctB family protein [Ndongobacter massiliensis]